MTSSQFDVKKVPESSRRIRRKVNKCDSIQNFDELINDESSMENFNFNENLLNQNEGASGGKENETELKIIIESPEVIFSDNNTNTTNINSILYNISEEEMKKYDGANKLGLPSSESHDENVSIDSEIQNDGFIILPINKYPPL